MSMSSIRIHSLTHLLPQILSELAGQCTSHIQDRRSHRHVQPVSICHRVAVRAACHGEHEREHNVARGTEGIGGAWHVEHTATTVGSRVALLPRAATSLAINQAAGGRQIRRLVDCNQRDREQIVRGGQQVSGLPEHGGL